MITIRNKDSDRSQFNAYGKDEQAQIFQVV
jgi:hypothetical protein